MFDHILLPVDGGAANARACEYVLLLAEVYDGEMHTLAVLDSSDVPENVDAAMVGDPIDTDARQTANEAIASVIEASEQAGVSVIDSIRRGTPVGEVLAYITENEIDLIVPGAHTPGHLARFLRNSIVEQVIRQSPVPVQSVREGEDQESVRIQQILVATGGSEGARRASEYVFDLDSIFDASVRDFYVVESRSGSAGSLHALLPREGEQILRRPRAGGAQAGIDVTPTTREGQPANEILPAASDCNADLIILGTQRKTGLDRSVMGSVATSVVRRANRPVLMVRELVEERSNERVKSLCLNTPEESYPYLVDFVSDAILLSTRFVLQLCGFSKVTEIQTQRRGKVLTDNFMNGRQSDLEESRPLGEATRVSNDELSGRENAGQVEGQRRETPESYPDRTRLTRSECSSCGASILSNRTKCRLYLSNHPDGTSDDSRIPDTGWTLPHVVHLLVEVSTFYVAVAKGAAVATLPTKADRDPAVSDCQLLYDLDTKPAAQLINKWPSLPEAVRATSKSGEQLLTTARKRTEQTESTQSSCEGAHTTFLYDEGGYDVSKESRLTDLLERVGNDVRLVSAIVLQRSIDDEHSEDRRPNTPSKTRLDYRKCGRMIEHQLQEFKSIPVDEWSGQPMWECQVCQSSRYGPDPE